MNPHQTQPSQNGEQTSAQPVAYDTQGRPLYLHPADASGHATPQPQQIASPIMQSVHISRPLEPEQVAVPAHVQQRHEESRRRFPQLNLSNGEYIIISIKRHVIGLVGIWLMGLGLIGALFAVLIGSQSGNGALSSALLAGLVMISVLILLGALVASYIYNQNRFYLTNESVIQEIQVSLFSKNEQTVSLSNIEDASYRQDGIFAYIFNYGTIRLSTEGDETTYRFSFVSDPKKQIAILNNAVEAFKNGRPVEPNPDQPS